MKKLTCDICGGQIIFDPKKKMGECSNCGIQYDIETLKEIIEQIPTDASAAEKNELPEEKAEENTNIKSEQLSCETVNSVTEKSEVKKVDNKNNDDGSTKTINALVDNWKTNYGFSVCGILCLVTFNWVAMSFSFGLWMLIGYLIAGFIYAVVVYPSFLTEKPKVLSCQWASFLNCFFGGIIFGPLWNRNLFLAKKGDSAMVCAIFYAAVIAFLLFAFFNFNNQALASKFQDSGAFTSDGALWISQPINISHRDRNAYDDLFDDHIDQMIGVLGSMSAEERHQFKEHLYDTKKEVSLDQEDVRKYRDIIQSFNNKQSSWNKEHLNNANSTGKYIHQSGLVFLGGTNNGDTKSNKVPPRPQCQYDSSHAVMYSCDFEGGLRKCNIQAVQLFLHDAGGKNNCSSLSDFRDSPCLIMVTFY